MPSLDTRGIIAAAQLGAYTPIAAVSLYLTIRYALRRDAGWIFLMIFSLVRIAGGALIIAAEVMKNPKQDMYIAAYILFHGGLAPLMLSTLGFLGLAGQHTYSELTFLTDLQRAIAVFLVIALGLTIAGGILGTHLAPTQGHIGDILRKTGAALHGAVYVAFIWIHIRCWDDRYEMRSFRRRLLYGVLLALPVLGARVAYEILTAFSAQDLFGLLPSKNRNLAMFHPVTGKWIYYAILGIALEFIVAVLYLLFSTVLSRRHLESAYTPKGTFKSVGDFKKVYVTGESNSATNALVCVYDIFGYFPQTEQGADMLASSLNVTVYMPDFFEPNEPFPSENFPPTTDEGKKALQDFFGGTASPPAAVEKLTAFGQHLKSNGAAKVGAYGFCWGGKVTLVSGGASTPFDAVSIVHPAMMSVGDAEKLTVPLGIYPSKDEPVDEYVKIVNSLASKPFASRCDNKLYANMHHGWAAARADLNKPDNKEQFEDLYTRLAQFFSKAL
ncbi:Dienelactone hydrolase family protein [Mycena indigotica]|uniref:Dienelactone hydrolase family protein n=1 Tax=Mycena indigotica TaxID=2126181 RepID=A0A8H6SYE3_9AGAR|nr:Dienelactone hydrolase family protein [Mycena indigotica]KAF7306597.1 Dienelactone hydrolase family protein [Mycena indigotica]